MRRSLFAVPPPEGCAQNYRNLWEPPNARSALARQQCEDLWRDFADLADNDFIDRFPFELHQRWFEMYLGASLRRAGLNPSAPKPGPDFQVIVERAPIFTEAIAPTAGAPLHLDAVQEPVYTDADGEAMAAQVPHDLITLRLATAFRTKANAFDGYRRKGYVGAGDACIIAMNLRAIPHAWADAEEFWFRAMYGVGNRFVAIDRVGGATMAGREHRDLLQRRGGANEDVAPLLRPEHAGISGVLGSAADLANLPDPLGDDFLLMPHARPNSPYPRRGLLRRGREVVLHAEDGERWGVETIDHGAHAPRGPERFVVHVDEQAVEAEWAVEGRTLSVRVGGRGYDTPIAGGTDPAFAAREIALEIVRSKSGRRSRGRAAKRRRS
jgi:hypothetical protein